MDTERRTSRHGPRETEVPTIGRSGRDLSRQGGELQRGPRFPLMSWPGSREFMAYPFEMMRRFSEDVDRFFGETGSMVGGRSGDRGLMSIWTPRAEMFERDNRFVVRVELPGMQKEDVRVSVLNDTLIIEGERRQNEEQQRSGWYQSEWNYGRFQREIPLPETVDPSQVNARFTNGVLEVDMPQSQQANQRQEIQIQGS